MKENIDIKEYANQITKALGKGGVLLELLLQVDGVGGEDIVQKEHEEKYVECLGKGPLGVRSAVRCIGFLFGRCFFVLQQDDGEEKV